MSLHSDKLLEKRSGQFHTTPDNTEIQICIYLYEFFEKSQALYRLYSVLSKDEIIRMLI